MLTPGTVKPVDVVDLANDRIGSVTAMTIEAVLFDGLPSLVAPVAPGTVVLPFAVGVPETVQTMLAPGATVVGVDGEQLAERPGGKALTAQDAAIALAGATTELRQV